MNKYPTWGHLASAKPHIWAYDGMVPGNVFSLHRYFCRWCGAEAYREEGSSQFTYYGWRGAGCFGTEVPYCTLLPPP